MENNFEKLKIFIEDEHGAKYELDVNDIKKVSSDEDPLGDSGDLLFQLKHCKGRQRTLYLTSEVSEFLDAVCEKYNVKASNVVNKIIENYIHRE